MRRRTGNEEIGAGGGSRLSLLRDGLWTAQDATRTGLRRALEWVSWMLRRWLVWPLRDRVETAGAPARALGALALVLLAAGAGVAALLWATPDGGDKQATVADAAALERPAAARAPAAPERKPQPTLHGAAPVFGSGGVSPGLDAVAGATGKGGAGEGGGGSGADGAGGSDAGAGSGAGTGSGAGAAAGSGASAGAVADSGAGSGSAARLSSTPGSGAASGGAAKPARGPVAGRAAVAVARRFAGAFVSYEIGEAEDPAVQDALAATTTPELKQALLRRPPRLPANVEVPKAKVLNVVPAPSRAHVFPISVSLLRVGTTSELRLEMRKLKGKRWRVTNVLG